MYICFSHQNLGYSMAYRGIPLAPPMPSAQTTLRLCTLATVGFVGLLLKRVVSGMTSPSMVITEVAEKNLIRCLFILVLYWDLLLCCGWCSVLCCSIRHGEFLISGCLTSSMKKSTFLWFYAGQAGLGRLQSSILKESMFMRHLINWKITMTPMTCEFV